MNIGKRVLNKEYASHIWHLALHRTKSLLLICHGRSSLVVDIFKETEYQLPINDDVEYQSWLWLDTVSYDILLGVRGCILDAFTADALGTYVHRSIWHLQYCNAPIPSRIRDVAWHDLGQHGQYISVLLTPSSTKSAESNDVKLLLYQKPDFNEISSEDSQRPSSMSLKPVVAIEAQEIHTFLGFYKQSIVFLDHDLWIRSVQFTAPRAHQQTLQPSRYFFVPREFLGVDSRLEPFVLQSGTIVFPRSTDLLILQNGFDTAYPGLVREHTARTTQQRP